MTKDQLNYLQQPDICIDNPVVQRPWGGPYSTLLILELCPEAFAGGYVCFAVEAGYLDTGCFAPEKWVEVNCSGLVYDNSQLEEGYLMILMHIDESAVKPEAPYRYMISGEGAGEYTVAVLSMIGGELNLLFEKNFCCK